MVVWFWARQEIFLLCSVSRPAVGHPWVYSEVCFSWVEVPKVMKPNTDFYLMPKVRVYGTLLPLAHMLLWHGTYLTLCYTPHTYVNFLQWFFFQTLIPPFWITFVLCCQNVHCRVSLYETQSILFIFMQHFTCALTCCRWCKVSILCASDWCKLCEAIVYVLIKWLNVFQQICVLCM